MYNGRFERAREGYMPTAEKKRGDYQGGLYRGKREVMGNWESE